VGIEPSALLMLGKCYTTELLPQGLFVISLQMKAVKPIKFT
jgi:hypothetical protein